MSPGRESKLVALRLGEGEDRGREGGEVRELLVGGPTGDT